MAFAKQTVAPAAAVSTNEWKAAGYLNIYLPSKNGKRRKVGAIPLRESKENEKVLSDWLEADPENVKKFISKMIVDFQSATADEGSAFDLS